MGEVPQIIDNQGGGEGREDLVGSVMKCNSFFEFKTPKSFLLTNKTQTQRDVSNDSKTLAPEISVKFRFYFVTFTVPGIYFLTGKKNREIFLFFRH